MNTRLKPLRLMILLICLLAINIACTPETTIETVVVTATPDPNAEPAVMVVTATPDPNASEISAAEPITIVVTATPEPVADAVFEPKTPGTYTVLTIGDIDTMDTSIAYDNASGDFIKPIMEGLIYYNGGDANSFVPVLAEEVPSLENGLISEDGKTYTFNIREGITYHEGGDLTPSDVAYSFQRGLLQSDPNSPQWLWLEPILGYNACYDITEGIDPECSLAGDKEALLATATPEQLTAACELVKSAVVADNEAGTVVFTLAQSWGPMLSTFSSSYGGKILDMEWAIEQGAWDGSCDTWTDFYAPGGETELKSVINGTGPYKLEVWNPGEGYTLVANENYWRTEDMPAFDGGPSGSPSIKTFQNKIVNEFSTRLAALTEGDADVVSVPIADRPQADAFVGEECDAFTNECTIVEDNPDGQLRAWRNLPSVSRQDIFMTFNIAEDSKYVGSGALDGNGIPLDFFSDINVRRAFATCFDYDLYNEDILLGDGVRNNGPIITGMLGYNEDGPMHEYDPEKCEAELAEAWGGQLPETGFRMQIAYNTGNESRQAVGEILQENLSAINPAYQVEIVGLPWPTFLGAIRAGELPIFISGWLEDIHDPHNWVQPYTVGTYAGRQSMPQDMLDVFGEYATAGVSASDPAEREQAYFDMQEYFYEQVPQVTLLQATGVRYEQRYVDGWYFNPVEQSQLYALSTDGGQ